MSDFPKPLVSGMFLKCDNAAAKLSSRIRAFGWLNETFTALLLLLLVSALTIPAHGADPQDCLIESYNYPGYFLNPEGFLIELSPATSDWDKFSSTFEIVPGLADSDGNYVSFDSIFFPGHFLRHQDGRLKLECREQGQLFKEEASFKMKPGLADPQAFSFESYNYPGYYLRHKNFHLYLEPDDESELFKKDCTFWLREQKEGEGIMQNPSEQEAAESKESKVIYDSGNLNSVDNNPTCSPFFTLSEPQMITYINTYHWNYGTGAPGGTISLRNEDGEIYGPWEVETSQGQGGVPDAYWIAHPNEVLPAGSYMIEDSDPATWSQNSESPCGITRVEGYPATMDASEETAITAGIQEPISSATPTEELSYTPIKTKPANTKISSTPVSSSPGSSADSSTGSVDNNKPIQSSTLLRDWRFDKDFQGWERTGSVPPWQTVESAIQWYDQWGGAQGVIVLDACESKPSGYQEVHAKGGIKKSVALPQNAEKIIFNVVRAGNDGGIRFLMKDSGGQYILGEEVLSGTITRQLSYDVSAWQGKTVTLEVQTFGAGTDDSECVGSSHGCGTCCQEYTGIDWVKIY